MADPTPFWSASAGLVGAVVGVIAKWLWDSSFGWRSGIPIETWRTRAHQLERRVSEFYWPLYARLMRDDVVWQKVFIDLRSRNDREPPAWIKNLDEESRRKLSRELESKVLLPNHIEAVNIIRSSIHLANADSQFLDLLSRYVRHVDAYTSLRSSGLTDTDPIDVGEPYPPGLSDAVVARLRKYQADYDELMREKGVADFLAG